MSEIKFDQYTTTKCVVSKTDNSDTDHPDGPLGGEEDGGILWETELPVVVLHRLGVGKCRRGMEERPRQVPRFMGISKVTGDKKYCAMITPIAKQCSGRAPQRASRL